MEKNILRNEALNKRNNLTKEYVENASLNVISKLEDLNIFEKYNNIAIYYPIGNEINLLNLNKKYDNLLFPKYDKNDFNMKFVKTDVNNFKNNILENDKVISKDKIDCIIVPGIAFDLKNNRLGFGKGYYDRYLKDYKGIKIGVTYKDLIYDEIPILEHDIKMDFVISND